LREEIEPIKEKDEFILASFNDREIENLDKIEN
jgi:hypothetical protein